VKRWLKISLIVVGVVLAIAVGAFVIWALTPLGPGEVALRTLQSTPTISVASDGNGGFEFSSRSTPPKAGLVLYPGGRVDVRSYAPVAAAIASYGYLVVVPRVHLNLAVFEPNAANDAIEAHPEIESWSVGGHSLGGAMAAQYASKNVDRLDGLVLLAAYASGDSDLSKSDLQVIDIVGTLDGVISRENHAAGKALLPPDTDFKELEGGNHAQFGDYGAQPGDRPATITPAEQWQATADVVSEQLKAAAAE